MKPTEYLTITERPNTSITVMSDSRGPLIVASDGPGARAVRYTPDESAKFALAILEAAGVEARPIPSARIGTSEHLSDTAYELSTYIEKQQRAAAEAKEQAKEQAELEAAAAEYGEIYNQPQPNYYEPGHVIRALINRADEIRKDTTNGR